MGIHGLTTFIQENPDLLQDFQLHDTKVVIDGNNLYHQLFYHYHVNHHYNGDYDQFALKTKQFFHLFKSCNISPIIVFDGGYDTDDRKLQTTLERARTRLHLAGFISHGDRGKVLPILAYETFRHVLIELDIPHVTCDFEADSEIVVLANDLNCPVISMDSDFYIFEVQGGYIPFDSINHSLLRLKKDEVSDSETKSSEKTMGVKGLSTFIRHNQSALMADIRLRDAKVVIDGDNLYHYLYENFQVCKQYGGNYCTYSDSIRFFFEQFKMCNISPYVIFDGAHNRDDRKLKTLLIRARNRIKECDKVCMGQTGHIVPILAIETFRAVLIDLEIPHISCDFEADDQMVVLANELNCPIISDDSDFFIFNVKAGFIPLKFVKVKVKMSEKSKSKFLSAKLYTAEELDKRFPSTQGSILPLLATLFGNDFFDERILEEFYETLEKESVKSAVQESVRRYRTIDLYASYNLLQFLYENYPENNELANLACQIASSGLESNVLSSNNDQCNAIVRSNGTPLPSWFCLGHRKSMFPNFILNAVITNRIFLTGGVEYIDESSSFICSTRLRQVIYGILKAGISGMTDDNGDPTEEATVQEYFRVKRNLTSALVPPLFKVFRYGKVPTLEEVTSLSREQRRSLIFYSLDLKDELDVIAFPDSLKLVAATIIYWMQNSNPKPTYNNVKALLVYMMVRNLKTVLENGKAEGKQKIMETIENNFKDYYLEWKMPGIFGVDMRKVHLFSQFQTCMKASIALNQLLMCPLVTPIPADFFHGTFVYNLSADLNKRSDACENLYNLISNEDVFEVLDSWVTTLCRYDGESYKDVQRKVKSKKKKKRKKKSDAEEFAKLRSQLVLCNPFSPLGIDVSD
ncbi:hypothetical protein KUTeg_020021 [Tegillarca granosa]|uniref:XPG N-terminal domain-containing protein n=1 Tax=Tegillarca granosa TaxID=220873 RepID=A0ABQ9EJB9_TEGGR|nr:hypothetical protein KUTeg_020021 [Tegillarca granosa]